MIEIQCVHCSKPMNGGVYRKPNQCPHCFNLQDESLTARGRPRPGYVVKTEQKKATKSVQKKATFAANAPSEQMEVAEIPPKTIAKVIRKEKRVAPSATPVAKKTTAKRIEPKLDIKPLKTAKKATGKVPSKKTAQKAPSKIRVEAPAKVETPAKVPAKPKEIAAATKPKTSNNKPSKPATVKVKTTEAGNPFHPLYLELKPDMNLSLDIHLRIPKKADVVSLKVKAAKAAKAKKAALLRAQKAKQLANA